MWACSGRIELIRAISKGITTALKNLNIFSGGYTLTNDLFEFDAVRTSSYLFREAGVTPTLVECLQQLRAPDMRKMCAVFGIKYWEESSKKENAERLKDTIFETVKKVTSWE